MFGVPSFLYLAVLGYCIFDFTRRETEAYWLWIILLFQPFGAFIYLLVVVLPNAQVGGKMFATFKPQDRAEYKRLRQKVRDDSPLGDVERLMLLSTEFGKDDETIHYAGKVLDRDPESLAARYSAGIAHYNKGEHEESITLLEGVLEQDPKYRYGMPQLALAEAYRERGELDEARIRYEALLKSFSYLRARYRYAELLHEQGETEKAVKVMDEIVRSSHDTPAFRRREDAQWVRKAKAFLRKHGS